MLLSSPLKEFRKSAQSWTQEFGGTFFRTRCIRGQRHNGVTYDAPPQRVGVRAKHSRISVLFGEVHEERGEDETEKTDVQRREEFLTTNTKHRNCTGLPPSRQSYDNNKSVEVQFQRTCLCAQTTEPSSFHDPPLLSTRTIRKIWKKRRPRSAEVAKTFP